MLKSSPLLDWEHILTMASSISAPQIIHSHRINIEMDHFALASLVTDFLHQLSKKLPSKIKRNWYQNLRQQYSCSGIDNGWMDIPQWMFGHPQHSFWCWFLKLMVSVFFGSALLTLLLLLSLLLSQPLWLTLHSELLLLLLICISLGYCLHAVGF